MKKSWALVIIFFIWFVFASPFFLKGKIPFSATYALNNFSPWDAYPQFASPVKNAAMPDVIDQIYPWKHFTIQTLRYVQIPLWNPYSFSGTPHLANYQSAVLSPFNLLFFLFPFAIAWSLLVLLQPLLAGICMYVFMRSLSISKMGSVMSAIGFMFCGFLTTWMGYGTLGYAILFLPLALFGIEQFYKMHQYKFLIILAISIPLSFFSGHFQISLYFLLGIIVYQLYKFIAVKNIRCALYCFFASIIGILLATPQILPSIEFYTQSLRSGLFEKAEVIPWAYLPTFLAPDFFGNPVTRNDWFGHYAEWNGYVGVVPIMLGVYTVVRRKNTKTIALFVLGLIILSLAFATPVLDVVVNLHIPVLSTSAASRIIVLWSIVILICAGIGFDQLSADLQQKKLRHVYVWFGFFTVVFLFLWTIILGKLFLPPDKIIIARQNMVLPTIVFALTIIIVFLSAYKKKLFVILSVLILLTGFDMWRFGAKWQTFEPKDLVFPPVGITDYFAAHHNDGRVVGNLGAQMTTYYQLPAVDGYDPLYIHRYGQFVMFVQDGKLEQGFRSVVSFPQDGLYTPKAIDLLHVVYIIQKKSDDNQPWGFPFRKYPISQFAIVYEDKHYRVYKNTAAFPHAFLVSQYTVKHIDADILAAMFGAHFDLEHEVVLEEDPHISTNPSAQGSAQILSYSPNAITVQTNASSQQLLFLSDTYYPGWNATVDGRQTKIFRADYAFRSIVVPKGQHTVHFVYNPMSVMLGILLAVVGVICLIAGKFLYNRL